MKLHILYRNILSKEAKKPETALKEIIAAHNLQPPYRIENHIQSLSVEELSDYPQVKCDLPSCSDMALYPEWANKRRYSFCKQHYVLRAAFQM